MTTTFPAIVLDRSSTYDDGALVVTPNWNGSEVTLTTYEDINVVPSLPVGEFRLTPRQALRLAALLKDLAVEVRGFTAWDRNTTEFVGWYSSRDEFWADMETHPHPDGVVLIQATKAEVREAIDSLRHEGWQPMPGRWQTHVWDRIEELAITAD
jgi:hypothetical protein